MDTLVIEPRTKSDARFLRSVSKRIGAPVRTLEEIEDNLFFERMIAAETGILVPEEKVKELFRIKTAGK